MENKLLALTHAEEFYAMCLAATTLSTYNSPAADEDAARLMTFVGEAMGLDGETVSRFRELILGPLMQVGLVSDYHALASADFLEEEDLKYFELFEIKGRVLEELYLSECTAQTLDLTSLRQIRQMMKADYFHHPYEPHLRFWQIRTLSLRGSLSATRQLGLHLLLGIGCKADPAAAERALLSCVLWGDGVAETLLREQYRREGRAVKSTALATFYPTEGAKPSLPALLAAFYLLPRRETVINHPMAELLLSPRETYEQKARLIAQWSEKSWGNTLFPADGAKTNIGFQVKR